MRRYLKAADPIQGFELPLLSRCTVFQNYITILKRIVLKILPWMIPRLLPLYHMKHSHTDIIAFLWSIKGPYKRCLPVIERYTICVWNWNLLDACKYYFIIISQNLPFYISGDTFVKPVRWLEKLSQRPGVDRRLTGHYWTWPCLSHSCMGRPKQSRAFPIGPRASCHCSVCLTTSV